MENLVSRIKEECNKYAGVVSAYEEDFNPDDYAGGNIDDAWSGGMQDGCTDLANDILSIIENFKGE